MTYEWQEMLLQIVAALLLLVAAPIFLPILLVKSESPRVDSSKCPVCGSRMLHEQNAAGFLCLRCAEFRSYREIGEIRVPGAISVVTDERGSLSVPEQ